MFIRKIMSQLAGLLIILFTLTACVNTGTAQPASSTNASVTQMSPEPATPAPLQTSRAAGAGEETPATTNTPALVDTLGNLSYDGILADKPIRLTGGIAYYEDGSSGQPFVRLNDHLIARGDLNGDGAEDAVILLENESSGTGRFVYLESVLDAQGKPKPTKALLIGDRIRLKSLVIDNSQVVADLIAQGPGDPACCPSWNVRKVFSLEDSQLVEFSSEELSQISLDDLNTTEWRLVDLNANQEPVLPDTEITLQVEDGRLNGFAGCNDYNSTVSSDTNSPNSIVVGPIAATRKLCSEPVMSQENTYLNRLGKAVAWWYDAGHLELAFEAGEDGSGYLEYEPVTGTPTSSE